MEDNTINIYEKKAEEMTAMHIITADDKFTETEGGFVSFDFDGVHYDRIKVVRLFPFTDADKFLSIREHGNGEREIGIIEDIDAMTKETQEILRRQLRLSYFTPVIEKIYSIKDEYGFAYFHVMTDKGECISKAETYRTNRHKTSLSKRRVRRSSPRAIMIRSEQLPIYLS